jgi:hypothetical protein
LLIVGFLLILIIIGCMFHSRANKYDKYSAYL